MKEYHAICAAGAADLESVMRKTAMAEPVNVYALHGAGNGPNGYGRIIALRESEGWPDRATAPNGFTKVKPAHRGAWESVPYQDYHTILYGACRSVALF